MRLRNEQCHTENPSIKEELHTNSNSPSVMSMTMPEAAIKNGAITLKEPHHLDKSFILDTMMQARPPDLPSPVRHVPSNHAKKLLDPISNEECLS